MASKHRKSAKAVAKAHLDDPGGTGCIWRHRKKKHNAACCNHAKNSYDACQARAPYQSGEYYDRWQKEGTNKGIYKEKAEQKQATADAIKSGAKKPEKDSILEWAKSFDKSKWLNNKLAMYGDAFHRLEVKRDDAWKVGTTVSLAPGERARYFGRKGARAVEPNHAVPGLGAWYPYDHNHHHIVPVGSVANIVYTKKKSGSPATTEDRVDVMVQSGWNINGKGNVTILPLDVNVSKIVRLPAHCPWGGRHIPYLRAVDERLGEVRDKLEEGCEETDPKKKHEAHEAAGVEVKDLLVRASNGLYQRITRGNLGGKALGKI